MNKLHFLLLPVMFIACAAHAEVFKCHDDLGRVIYTNDRAMSKGCERLKEDLPVSYIPPAAGTNRKSGTRNQPTPASFPKVTQQEQQSRDQNRRQILETELSSEKAALSQAQQDMQQALASVGETSVNDQIRQSYQEKVDLHQRNITALEKEMQNIK